MDNKESIQLITAEELASLILQYEKDVDVDLIKKAYEFSRYHHRKQIRASGEPYFAHPLEVARIATTWHLDSTSIITALLHDTVEDTEATLEEIQQIFGQDVARLVNGVTKLNSIEIHPGTSEKTEQAENLRKLVLAMSLDIRVLLVKLLDRLHNMRTLQFVKKPEKRRQKSIETLEIYAPLALRIGMQDLYDELSNLCFKELHKDVYLAIERRKSQLFHQDKRQISHVIEELQSLLSNNGVQCTISGREKATHSIWRKMQKKNLPFEQLSDVFAYRIFLDTVGECYQALGIVHSRYPVVPGRFKDYISTPKSNNYQSLHTCVVGPGKNQIEIQIRTHSMHVSNEMGVAAHWEYKEGGNKKDQRDKKFYRWIRELLDILEHSHNPEEFLEHTKMEMYQDKVFCFTPVGEIISLPYGATPVDFAYAIHSEIGNRCMGCKVNGRMMPLRVELKNGDQVEIITAKNQSPSLSWERFVVTGKAKSCIRRYVREHQKDEYAHLGRNMLKAALKSEHADLSDPVIKKAAQHLKLESPSELLSQIGMGFLPTADVIPFFKSQMEKTQPKIQDTLAEEIVPKSKRTKAKNLSSDHFIEGLIPGISVHFAKCCYPIPGEKITGIISSGRGVSIHNSSCKNLQQFMTSPERWLDISWSDRNITEASSQAFDTTLRVVVQNKSGALAALSAITTKHKANIDNLIVTNRDTEHCDLLLSLQVRNLEQLHKIMVDLRNERIILSVDRA